MTLEEKLAQLVGFWDKGDGEAVAPLQGEFAEAAGLDEATRHGLGHLTRPYGTRPVDPVERARWLWEWQRRLVTGTRLGIPALVHEECLTGLAAWTAATFPTPLAWGAAFDPELVEEMGAADRRLDAHARHPPGAGAGARRRPRPALGPGRGVHRRGPVPRRHHRHVLRARAAVGRACTPPSSTSSATRPRRPGATSRPVHAGPRELADVLLVPFEMAVLDGGARSVMHSYAEIDGVPGRRRPRPAHRRAARAVGLRRHRRRRLLRRRVPAPAAPRRGRPRRGGRRWRWPPASTSSCPPVTPTSARSPTRCATGRVDEALVDRAVLRALRQKEELGLLDATFEDEPPADVDLDGPRAPPGRAPGWPRSRWCCWPTTAPCRSTGPRRGGGHRPERRPRRGAVRLLLLPQPRHPAAPGTSSRHRRADRARGARRGVAGRRARLARGLRGRRRRPSAASPDAVAAAAALGRRRASSSATSPGSSGAAPSGRGATATTSSCPACSAGSSRPCSTPGRRSCSCCSPAGRTPSAGRWTRCAAVVQAFFPGEEGGAADRRACSPGGSTPRGGCR